MKPHSPTAVAGTGTATEEDTYAGAKVAVEEADKMVVATTAVVASVGTAQSWASHRHWDRP
jgi:hypothetical protein